MSYLSRYGISGEKIDELFDICLMKFQLTKLLENTYILVYEYLVPEDQDPEDVMDILSDQLPRGDIFDYNIIKWETEKITVELEDDRKIIVKFYIVVDQENTIFHPSSFEMKCLKKSCYFTAGENGYCSVCSRQQRDPKNDAIIAYEFMKQKITEDIQNLDKVLLDPEKEIPHDDIMIDLDGDTEICLRYVGVDSI